MVETPSTIHDVVLVWTMAKVIMWLPCLMCISNDVKFESTLLMSDNHGVVKDDVSVGVNGHQEGIDLEHLRVNMERYIDASTMTSNLLVIIDEYHGVSGVLHETN
jgi:hypothetical protein